VGGQINSLRFSNSGKMVCAVSNDGSVNAWVYPLELRVVEPELTTTTGQLQGKEAEGDGEERDGVKRRGR
jgi:WD40 repeat protein